MNPTAFDAFYIVGSRLWKSLLHVVLNSFLKWRECGECFSTTIVIIIIIIIIIMREKYLLVKYHLPVSWKSSADRCASFGSCKPHILFCYYYYYHARILYFFLFYFGEENWHERGSNGDLHQVEQRLKPHFTKVLICPSSNATMIDMIKRSVVYKLLS